jgi:hypothetical protein
MKWLIFLLLFILFIAPGCDIRKREQLLAQKDAELKQKEQQLLLREKSLEVREAQLSSHGMMPDSASQMLPDSLRAKHGNLPGIYDVTMNCIETTCAGSAVGDTKTEQWQINFENNRVIVKAMSDKKLIRSYSGTYIGNMIELAAQQDSLHTPQTGEIIVRMQETKENVLEGQREIIRPEQCRILYKLELLKH